MEQTVNFAIASVYIALFLGISMVVARWQERSYGCEDDTSAESVPRRTEVSHERGNRSANRDGCVADCVRACCAPWACRRRGGRLGCRH